MDEWSTATTELDDRIGGSRGDSAVVVAIPGHLHVALVTPTSSPAANKYLFLKPYAEFCELLFIIFETDIVSVYERKVGESATGKSRVKIVWKGERSRREKVAEPWKGFGEVRNMSA